MQNDVTFKGTVNGLTIIMKSELDFESILKQIEDKVISAGKFFKGASLVVKYKGRKLSEPEEQQILKLLKDKSGAEINSIEEQMEDTSRLKRKGYFADLEEGVTKIYRGTVRSGNLIEYDGNVVVIGDVNPGGELVATGNIIVMGSLRGIVHAGADGNKHAVVVALNLQPTQLRIADLITRSPDEKNSKVQYMPEIAFVKEDKVYIESYLSGPR